LRRFFFAGFVLVLLFGVAIQLVPYGRDHPNPPVRREPAWNTAQTRALFVRACADCHSNQTVWPWYSNIAPMSWLVTRDVLEGRDKFNISDWDGADNEGDEAAETVRDGGMPPFQYLMAHPSARLSPQEQQAFIKGLVATFGDKHSDDSKDDDD
jgi:mono/diheme cytochrome c family protein